jgi:hypothetical protein
MPDRSNGTSRKGECARSRECQLIHWQWKFGSLLAFPVYQSLAQITKM